MYDRIVDLLTAFLAMEQLVADETVTFVRNVWNENRDRAQDLAKKIQRRLVFALIFTIISFIVIIFGGSGVVTGLFLGLAMLFLAWAGALIGFAWIALEWAYLAVLLGKSVLIDAHGIGLGNIWKILKSTGSWASDKAAIIIKLAAAAIPGVNLAEVQNAFTNGFPATNLDPMFESTRVIIENMVAKARSYGAAIKAGWITWMSVLAILFIVNIIGFPKFLNNAANLSLALFLVVVTIYSAINPPPKRTGFHYLWMAVCILVLGVLVYRAIDFYKNQDNGSVVQSSLVQPAEKVLVSPFGEGSRRLAPNQTIALTKSNLPDSIMVAPVFNNYQPLQYSFNNGTGWKKQTANIGVVGPRTSTWYLSWDQEVWIKIKPKPSSN